MTVSPAVMVMGVSPATGAGAASGAGSAVAVGVCVAVTVGAAVGVAMGSGSALHAARVNVIAATMVMVMGFFMNGLPEVRVRRRGCRNGVRWC